MASTNYSKVTINSERFSKSIATEDVLLLEGGDKLLLEDGTDSILLDILSSRSTDFTGATIRSTNYS